jgi:4-hydroxybenzoate polyprenyltransferase
MIFNTTLQKTNKLSSIIALLRLDKPIGIYLLLWPTLMALWIAGNGKPDPSIVCIFILGVVLMRSVGCVINDLADQKFDKAVTRTHSRPLVSDTPGHVRSIEAKVIFCILLALALFLVLQLNNFTLGLSCVALVLAMVYPFMKRYTHWPQIFLGITFSFGIPMAFAALESPIGLSTMLLFLANACWIIAYDTQYAMADREDDLKIGVKSTAILFGKHDLLIIGVFQVITISLLIGLGKLLTVGFYYYFGVLLSVLLFIYHQYLIRNRNPGACLNAFKHNHYVGLVLFMGLIMDYLNQLID